jgi:CHAT domain-containing protein/tetratricopeptide (TPR) repeat protein
VQAGRGYRRFRSSNPELAWKFRILEAKSTLARGLFEDVLKLFKSQSLPSGQPDLGISVNTLTGLANVHLQNLPEAEHALNDALDVCDVSPTASCGDLFIARGLLATEQNESDLAENLYRRGLAFARLHHDPYLEATAWLNLGNESLEQGHFDEAIDRSESAYRAAKIADAKILELVIQGNIGWANYRLGDSEKALTLALESERAAAQLGDVFDQENELTNIGYVQMDEHHFDVAAQSFQKALKLAEDIKAHRDTYNALRVLARLALQTGDLDQAIRHAEEALDIARKSKRHQDELYPTLVRGQVAARRRDTAAAEKAFLEVESDSICPIFLRWEAQHSLARLYEDQTRWEDAGREYRAALATFEAARDNVRHEDSHLSFLTNGLHIYDDYLHFLVARGMPDEALRWADHSRARTLAEGLGLLPSGASVEPPAPNGQKLARGVKGTILFYWLGEKQSYLWAITSQKTSLFPLPGAAEIDATVQRYREALGGQDVLESADQDGRALYRELIEPARALLPKDGRVFIIPDGSLNNLNFETLLVSEPKLHYWIEDAIISNASSLRVLGALRAPEKERGRNLLLIGDNVSPSEKYPPLPKAALQMESVAKHFSPEQQWIFSGKQATPAAYLDSNPERFSYIHFVAHGTASRLSPLDSAIVLSKTGTVDDSFKLYAREIVRHRLRADLVTISACYGAGERSYAGEGLVGLSWAFLGAGAHNVIAALWDVADASTEQLMETFYAELDRGAPLDSALRAAKLSLLRGRFHNPFYWAPFQLYKGS